MRIKIEVNPAKDGQFSETFLCQEIDGVQKKAQLNIAHFHNLYDFTKETSSVGFDFFLIAAIVYGTDDLLSRELYSYNGWTREIEIEFPVKNIDYWKLAITELEETLGFLTGDVWSITFRQMEVEVLYLPRKNRRKSNIPKYNYPNIEFVSLFSGGLDSLIGVINKLNSLDNGKIGLLVSHFDPTYTGPKKDQTLILEEFEKSFDNKYKHIRATVGLSQRYINGDKITKDANQRSRSILFIGIAAYLLNKVPTSNTILIPENGTISLNHPLTKSRTSSLSTRTTHPYFFRKLQESLEIANLNISLINPFKLDTKGKMVVDCDNTTILQKTYPLSVSCGKRGHKVHWENRNAKQCGICMPCIYRRAALHKNNWDTDTYGNDLLRLTDMNKAKPDVKALFDYLGTSISLKEIKRNLLVNGSIEISNLDAYANLVHNSRVEMLNWIRDKGNDQLKKILKIQ
ncbi:Qat anti-phage system QueC-like protein QatC [Mesonia aquimarina]|uniref:Qat anti-phage system QueC-like protein QatC n=1 Tax=Mesonia aquimarina TaxID=1504967 RepID=UPI000EF60D6E|nr:Qat anti-phage system QueC-like protein QatC [Mesonia aquimarina]|tara:strand:- start:752 stop:2125 length:1374 start_codon:yes stop_codon:yes gene_type:complete